MTTLAQTLLTRLVNDPRVCVTVAEMLFDGYAETEKQLHNVLDTLERRIFVVKQGRGCYQASADGRTWIAAGLEIKSGQGRHPRKQARGVAAMAWAWLRIHRKGRLEDILATVATAASTGAEMSLRRYFTALIAAGYVQRIRRGGGCARYLLVSDTGRAAPVYRRGNNTLYDPNLKVEIALNPDKEGHGDV